MQTIPIIWPILACALLTGILFAWVWFVALPRLRRGDGKLRRSRQPALRKPSSTASIVDADQQAIRRNV